MHLAERFCTTVRHTGFLAQADWLWDRVRPLYDQMIALTGQRGLVRIMNGTDRMLLTPAFRAVQEVYEPDVWHSLMSEVRAGDTVADVGVFIGLYTLALAQRVGAAGRVFAFEPDPANYEIATQHIALNGLSARVELIQAAVGATDGQVAFSAQAESGHVLNSVNNMHANLVPCVTLDQIFARRRLDILKVDVEGYEEMVLLGGQHLLCDPTRSPRALYIEVHPYAWPATGTTSESLLSLLINNDYYVSTVQGKPVTRIGGYGEIVARKKVRS